MKGRGKRASKPPATVTPSAKRALREFIGLIYDSYDTGIEGLNEAEAAWLLRRLLGKMFGVITTVKPTRVPPIKTARKAAT